jgi:hypothetical protein
MAMNRWNTLTDKQLVSILDEPGTWVVTGRNGNQHLCFTLSLRAAIERGRTFARAGAIVHALCRQPSDNVIVLSPQMCRLAMLIAGSHVPVDRRATVP